MAVFRISADDWRGLKNIDTVLTRLFDNIDPDNVYINKYLRKYVLENIKRAGRRLIWQSDSYVLNPKYNIKAMSRAALENHGGVSPLGSITELETYLIPYCSLGKYRGLCCCWFGLYWIY